MGSLKANNAFYVIVNVVILRHFNDIDLMSFHVIDFTS